MEIIEDSIEELWCAAARALLSKGHASSPRGQNTRELLGMQLVLTNPKRRIPHLPQRKFSLAYAMGELAWYLSGDDSLKFIQRYAPSYDKYSDDGKRLHGAYGPRIFGMVAAPSGHATLPESQWNLCKAMLQKDPDSRQAVISIYRAWDCGYKTKDMPCTLTLQFLIRNSQLNLVVNMRSNDLWLGGLYDVFCFTALQELMANELQLPVGVYYHHVGSFHLYERNRAQIEGVLNDACQPGYRLAQIRVRDTIQTLLVDEDAAHRCDVQDALTYVCAEAEAMERLPSLWDLAGLAWRWRRVCGSATVKEEQRRFARGLLQDKLGSTFDCCFY